MAVGTQKPPQQGGFFITYLSFVIQYRNNRIWFNAAYTS